MIYFQGVVYLDSKVQQVFCARLDLPASIVSLPFHDMLRSIVDLHQCTVDRALHVYNIQRIS